MPYLDYFTGRRWSQFPSPFLEDAVQSAGNVVVDLYEFQDGTQYEFEDGTDYVFN